MGSATVDKTLALEYGISGGVANGGICTVAYSTIAGNAADGGGGGVANDSGTLTVTHSTISGNDALRGDGVANSDIFTLTHSTVTGNAVARDGGGIRNGYSGVLTLSRTLVTGNTAPFGPELANSGGLVVEDSYSLFGVAGDADVVGFLPDPTDVAPGPEVQLSDILEPALADRGGPTLTHALVPGSPALNVSPADADCAPTDQRGVSRPQGARYDIGAVEQGPVVLCGGQPATLVGTPGDDVLTGTPVDEVIHGLRENDIIHGLGGHDILCGGDGDDTLRGRAGDDTLYGDPGRDRLLGNAGNDTLRGGAGPDRLDGGSNTDFCDGGAGCDTVVAGCERVQGVP
jgi:Ca2+-binding RTX toxin-like protein